MQSVTFIHLFFSFFTFVLQIPNSDKVFCRLKWNWRANIYKIPIINIIFVVFFWLNTQILETERDAHLSAANQYSDKLKLIQKKSDFGLTPDPIKDYNDEFADDYDERTQFDGQKSHLQRQKPWRFVLMNYGHAANRNHKNEQAIGNAKMHSLSGSVDELMNAPRSQQKIYRPKPAKSSATNADASDSTNDLDWITSNTELSSANDYDALYDDVNEKRSSSSNLKFDHYRRNGPLAQRKEHLN